jgi:transcriptional regulator with XRE-family HTH domain
MKAQLLKAARQARGWTQVEAAARLGLSQPYLAMLERGQRRLTPRLARKAARVFQLPPTALPLSEPPYPPARTDPQYLAESLAALGYPGFGHLRTQQRLRNPAELLLSALTQRDLEPRQAEALPWLVMRFPSMDLDWLLSNARLRDLQNRLGFVVALAKRVAERLDGTNSSRANTLRQLASALEQSRLAREDTLCQESLNEVERRWLRENRGDLARHWNLLTGWTPEALRYVL